MFPKNEFQKFATKHMGIHEDAVRQHVDHINAIPGITGFTPQVIEERQLNVVGMDVFSRLMMDRIIFLGVPINDYVANVVQAQLLFLESTDPKRDINMFINSPGGSVIAGLGIYDTMQYVSPEVATICTGLAASMGSVLLSSGNKGKRTCLQHSRVMIHQPSGAMQGQFSDMEITYNLIKDMRKELYNILAYNTGQKFEKIEEDSDRDNWMTANEAKAYGLVDEVLTRDNPRKKA